MNLSLGACFSVNMIKEVSPLTLSSMIASDGQMILFYLPQDHDFYYSLSKLESEISRLVF